MARKSSEGRKAERSNDETERRKGRPRKGEGRFVRLEDLPRADLVSVMPAMQASGVSWTTLAARVALGWSLAQAATVPPTCIEPAPLNEFNQPVEVDASVLALCLLSGVQPLQFRYRLACGWEPLEAATRPWFSAPVPDDWDGRSLLPVGHPAWSGEV